MKTWDKINSHWAIRKIECSSFYEVVGRNGVKFKAIPLVGSKGGLLVKTYKNKKDKISEQTQNDLYNYFLCKHLANKKQEQQ